MDITKRVDFVKLEGTTTERLTRLWTVRAALLREYYVGEFPFELFKEIDKYVSNTEIAYLTWDTSSEYDDDGGYYTNVDDFYFYDVEGRTIDIQSLDEETDGSILGDLDYWDFINLLKETFEMQGTEELTSYCPHRIYNPKYVHLKETLEQSI